MKIPSELVSIKDKIQERQELNMQYNHLKERANKAIIFFEQQAKTNSASKIADGIKLFYNISNEMSEIANKMFSLDTIIVSRLESELLDSLIEIRTNDTKTDAGDTIKSSSFFFAPKCYTDDDMCVIDEDDLWFLKIIKSAFDVKKINIETKKGVMND